MTDFLDRMKRVESGIANEEEAASKARNRLANYLQTIHHHLFASIKQLEQHYVCTVSGRAGEKRGVVDVCFPIETEPRMFRGERVVRTYILRLSCEAYEPWHPPEVAGKFITNFRFEEKRDVFPDGRAPEIGEFQSVDPIGKFSSNDVDDALDYFARCVLRAVKFHRGRIRMR